MKKKYKYYVIFYYRILLKLKMVLSLFIILIAVIRISCVNDNGYCDYKEEVSAKQTVKV